VVDRLVEPARETRRPLLQIRTRSEHERRFEQLQGEVGQKVVGARAADSLDAAQAHTTCRRMPATSPALDPHQTLDPLPSLA